MMRGWWVLFVWVMIALVGVTILSLRKSEAFTYVGRGFEPDSTYNVIYTNLTSSAIETLAVVAQADSSIYFYIDGVSPTVEPGTPLAAPPPVPTFDFSNWGVDSTEIEVVWNTVSDPDFPVRYMVKNVTDTDSSAWLGGAVAVTDTTWTGLTPNTEYTFQVRAKDGVDSISAYSSGQATYSLCSPTPAPVVSNPGSQSLDVDPSGGTNPVATSLAIRVERLTDPGVYYWVDSVEDSLTSTAEYLTDAAWATKTVNGLASSEIYEFDVQAKNGDDLTVIGGAAAGTTSAGGNTGPEDFAMYDVRPYPLDANQMLVMWNATTDVDADSIQYQVYNVTSDAHVGSDDTWAGDTTLLVSGLEPDSAYVFKVRARDFKADTTESDYSDWTSTATDVTWAKDAVGYGANIGGLYKPTVTVTNTNDTGAGSLREALAAGNRYIYFDASLAGATISLTSEVPIDIPLSDSETDTMLSANITIDGSSLSTPVSIKNPGTSSSKDVLSFETGSSYAGHGHNVVIHNIRFIDTGGNGVNHLGQPGDEGGWGGTDGVFGVQDTTQGAYKVLIDHCSFVACADGGVDYSNYAHNMTIQYSLLADSPNKGSLIKAGARRVSFYRNILTENFERFPTARSQSTTDADSGGVSFPNEAGCIDVRNNIIHAWSDGNGAQRWYGTIDDDAPREMPSIGNAISNLFIPGPLSDASRALVLRDGNKCHWDGNWFYGDAGPIGQHTDGGDPGNFYLDPPLAVADPIDLHLGYTISTWDSATVRDSLQYSCGASPNTAVDSTYIALVMAAIPSDETAPDAPAWSPGDFVIAPTSITVVCSTVTDPSTPVSYAFSDTTTDVERDYTSNDTLWAETGLSANSVYVYRARARDAAGNASGWGALKDTASAIETPTSIAFFNIDSTNFKACVPDSELTVNAYAGFSGTFWYDTGGALNTGELEAQAEVETWVSDTTITASGLTPNTYYGPLWVKARNRDSVSTVSYEGALVATNVGRPYQPTVLNATNSTLDVSAIGLLGSNPAASDIALRVNKKLTTEATPWVAANGARGTGPVYQSAATWDTITVTGLEAQKTYNCQIQVRGKNGDTLLGTETQYSTLTESGGGVYYVSAGGSDAADGLTYGSAWKTIKTKLALLSTRDLLYLLDEGGDFNSSNQGGVAFLNNIGVGPRGVSLKAYPGETPVIELSDATDRCILLGSNDDSTTISGITFRNHLVNNETIFSSGDTTLIEDCVFDSCANDASNFAVQLFQGINSTIDGCSFINTPNDDFYHIGVNGTGADDNITITNCTFNEASDLADSLGVAAGILLNDVDSVSVSNCIAYNCGEDNGESGNGTDFIAIQSSDHVGISDVTFQRYRWGLTGTDAHTMGNCDFVSIVGSDPDYIYITRCGVWGAGHGVGGSNATDPEWSGGIRDLHVTYCYFDSTYDDAIFITKEVSSAWVEWNIIHAPGNNSMDIVGDSVTVQHNTIVRGWDEFRILSDADTVWVYDNIIYDIVDATVFVTVSSPAPYNVFDNNVYYDPDGGVTFSYDGGGQNWATWQGAGRDASGFNENAYLSRTGATAWPYGAYVYLPFGNSPAVNNASDGTYIGKWQQIWSSTGGKRSGLRMRDK
jgi:hypothetical protein